jgi:hypothetical protein
MGLSHWKYAAKKCFEIIWLEFICGMEIANKTVKIEIWEQLSNFVLLLLEQLLLVDVCVSDSPIKFFKKYSVFVILGSKAMPLDPGPKNSNLYS